MTLKRISLALAIIATLCGLVAAAPTAAAAPPDRYDDVAAIRALPDGSTEVTTYFPAPGVTSRQLYDSLRRDGVTGLVDPDAGPVGTFDNYSCYYGTAYALQEGRCPPIFWRKNGRTRPLVHFRDYSGAAWPVGDSARKWNESIAVDVSYQFGYCSSLSGAHCVDVFSGDFGNTTWVGEARYSYDSQRAFVDGSAYIWFNDYHSGSGAKNRGATCHELGHLIGVGHNASRSTSCMYYLATGEAQYPNGDDYALLSQVVYRT